VHHWRVAAANAGGSSAWTEAWSFRTEKKVYAVPSRLYPPDGARMVPVALTMRWDSTTSARVYHVQLALDTAFTSCIVDDSAIVSLDRAVAGLAHFTAHAWRIRALYATGASAWSPAWRFSTTLAPAVLLAPADSAAGIPLAPAFAWTPVQGASAYRLEIAASTAFTPPVFDTSGIASAAYGGRALSPATRYYWRVRGVNADGEGEPSSVFTFLTTSSTAAEPDGGASDFLLEQNAPNPASTSAELAFRSARGGYATLRVFDALGRCVATVADGEYAPGRHAVHCDVSALPPGSYCLVLTAQGRTATRMMAVRR
jgi:hypothetical protein